MKQLLLIALSLLFGLHILQAQEKNPYENTTWKVIWERLFDGNNTHVFRYEEDIRLQLIGVHTQQDSAMFIKMIAELNELVEIVEINLVNDNPNFTLKIAEKNGVSMNNVIHYSGVAITNTKLQLDFTDLSNQEQVKKHTYYHVIRNLTKLFEPRYGHSGYGGIFDSPKAEDSAFHEIDKDLLRKIYSQDFYKQLKKHTLKQRGYLFYLKLRYDNLMKNLVFSIKLILILFGFIYFLSKESKREKNPTLWLYLKQRTIILMIIPFLFSIFKITSGASSPFTTLLITTPVYWVANFISIVIFTSLVLILIYYTESFFLKKINSFAGKQSFIFISH